MLPVEIRGIYRRPAEPWKSARVFISGIGESHRGDHLLTIFDDFPLQQAGRNADTFRRILLLATTGTLSPECLFQREKYRLAAGDCRRRRSSGAMAKWLTQRIANPLSVGSNPTRPLFFTGFPVSESLNFASGSPQRSPPTAGLPSCRRALPRCCRRRCGRSTSRSS